MQNKNTVSVSSVTPSSEQPKTLSNFELLCIGFQLLAPPVAMDKHFSLELNKIFHYVKIIHHPSIVFFNL